MNYVVFTVPYIRVTIATHPLAFQFVFYKVLSLSQHNEVVSCDGPLTNEECKEAPNDFLNDKYPESEGLSFFRFSK